MFNDTVEQLGKLRVEFDALNEEYKAALKVFEIEHADLIERRATAKAKMEQVENALRETITEHYAETGQKKPHKALGVRVSITYNYDKDAALEWAMTHQMVKALKLDGRAFTAMVKAGAVPADELAWSAEEKVTATIAKDLSDYIE